MKGWLGGRGGSIVRVIFIPFCNQLVAGLADVLLMEDPACECARHLQSLDQGSIQAVLDAGSTVLAEFGCLPPQPFASGYRKSE